LAQEVFLGDANSMHVRIPPMIWNDVKGLGQDIFDVNNNANVTEPRCRANEYRMRASAPLIGSV